MKVLKVCITLAILSSCAVDDEPEPLPTCTELGAGDNLFCPAAGNVCSFEGEACCVPCSGPRCAEPDPRCVATD